MTSIFQQLFLLLTNGAFLRPKRWPGVFDPSHGWWWIGWKDGTCDQKFGHLPAEKMPVVWGFLAEQEPPQRILAASNLHFHVIFIKCTLRTLLKVKLKPPKKFTWISWKKRLSQCFLGRRQSSGSGHARNPYWKKVIPEECWGNLSGSELPRWKFQGGWFSLVWFVWFRVESAAKKSGLLMVI